ncbi:hypothetical protein CEUSTIGMA_g11096.t1 [Chlamydomonas eustigma]|uniref:Ammonium transporter n=1 Tax=Chlamydomonas eustigma TaxID=1157962 RepID=A0A250XKQ0_9CHLO|nr:hypothetical protein CEUSTIGMA_g11096.t1 [Chlamydomonas eustigma]|eukprot:GAX83671.1 hypothetical protein CEUSTIGMA_g11096.t1 [Chlamydomonas eustigma]
MCSQYCHLILSCSQIGFAMFVAGVVRAKNIASILLKSIIDSLISAIGYYLVGYAFTMGNGNPNGGFIGDTDFALSNSAVTPYDNSLFLWYWVFCAASTTILVGSLAERCTFVAYVVFVLVYVCWIYPVYAHWTWSPNGWLTADNPISGLLGMGAIDFAGSGVVHTMGGFCAMVGSLILGPRVGRYAPATRHMFVNGHNPQLYLLGTLLLWLGWYSFNAISLLNISSVLAATTVARTTNTTTLAAASAGLTALLLVYYHTKTWNMLSVCNGVLGGLVAITAGCSVVEPWAAIICGVIAAPCVVYGEVLQEWLQIDDPAGAFAIHGLSGIWGVMFVGLLAKEQYIIDVYHKPPGRYHMGIFYGGHGQLLLCQFISVVVCITWACFWSYLVFTMLNWMGCLRVPLEVEAVGLDASEMGAQHGAGLSSLTDAKFEEPVKKSKDVSAYTRSSPMLFGSNYGRQSQPQNSVMKAMAPPASKAPSISGTTASATAGLATVSTGSRAISEQMMPPVTSGEMVSKLEHGKVSA